MEENEYYSTNEKIEWKTIVLEHVRCILKLTLKHIPEEQMMSYCKTYYRSVQSLSDVLISFYDDRLNEAYEKFNNDIKNINDNACIHGRIKNEPAYISGVLCASRSLFRELNLLLKRNDFLSSSLYSEGDEE